jgi:NAD(P)-dependent dehydrogenase (short-subunit alcohol dehydrogenase family)
VADYGLGGKVAVVTAGGGAICGEIARELAREGAHVAVWDIDGEAARGTVADIAALDGHAIAVACDAPNPASVKAALDATLAEFGTVDILVNGAGGTSPDSTTSPDLEFFDISLEAIKASLDLNYLSTVVCSQAVGRVFAERRAGAILNVSSIAADRPLTRVVSYSSAKAAVNSFTKWLAVHMAENYSPTIRVNAIAPGFLLTAQNRFLLVDRETGEMTERGRRIISNVPMRRYGDPSEIASAALFMLSDRASFVTGAVVPVDGGFAAFSGV